MPASLRTTVLALAGLAAASTAAWWWQKPSSTAATAMAQPAQAPASQGKPGGAGRPVAVEATKVRTMALADEAEAVGSLRSRQAVVLRPEVSGRIAQLHFRDGERVRKGQLLVQFDDQLPRAQLQQSRAELSIAQANHRRNEELVAKGFISQRSLDESAAALEVARAKLALAEATVARLKLVAPFDGVAGIRGVNVGDYLKDGADIVNIEDLDALYVDFRLPERLQSKVRVGLAARVTFDALPGAVHRATVQAISPQLDADGRSLAVRACIDNRQQTLRPGMFARVNTVFGERSQALVIPEEAIVPDGKGTLVFKLVPAPEGDGKIAKRTPVRVGLRSPGWVEVTEGLGLEDDIVTAGQQRLQRDGMTVRVVPLGKPAEPSASRVTPAMPPATAGNPCAVSGRAALSSAPAA